MCYYDLAVAKSDKNKSVQKRIEKNKKVLDKH